MKAVVILLSLSAVAVLCTENDHKGHEEHPPLPSGATVPANPGGHHPEFSGTPPTGATEKRERRNAESSKFVIMTGTTAMPDLAGSTSAVAATTGAIRKKRNSLDKQSKEEHAEFRHHSPHPPASGEPEKRGTNEEGAVEGGKRKPGTEPHSGPAGPHPPQGTPNPLSEPRPKRDAPDSDSDSKSDEDKSSKEAEDEGKAGRELKVTAASADGWSRAVRHTTPKE